MPIDNNFFAQALPKHEHRTLHILLAVLAVVFVVGSVYFYKTKLANRPVIQETSNVDDGRMSAEELAKITQTLNENAVGKTPLTPAELKQITSNLNKQGTSQKPMTQAEIQEAINLLNKK